jgi:DNA repair protein RadC
MKLQPWRTYGSSMRYQRAEPSLKLDGLAAARSFFAGCLAEGDPKREQLWVAHVDEQANCVTCHGTRVTRSGGGFPIREIISDAVSHRSARIVLVHNHPSGDARPSDSDCGSTRRLATAAEALDGTVLDHLIFGWSECSSMRRLG